MWHCEGETSWVFVGALGWIEVAGLEKGGEKLVRLLPTSVAATQYLLPQCADAQAWFLRRNRQIMLYHGTPGLEKTSFFCKSGSFWQQVVIIYPSLGKIRRNLCAPVAVCHFTRSIGQLWWEAKGMGKHSVGSMRGGGLQNIYNIFGSTGITGNQVQVQARMGFPLWLSLWVIHW